MLKTKLASVSVIIPCFCCSKTIEIAVNSVLNQTLMPSEIIIVNDGSNDNGKTRKKLSLIKKKIINNYVGINVKIINLLKNKGPSHARNLAWDQSSYNYIAFLDADDVWDLKKIELQYKWMENHKDINFTGHKSIVYNDKKDNKESQKLYNKEIFINNLIFKNYFPTRSVMIKNIINERFDESKRYGEDFDLWLRLIEHNKMFFFKNTLSYSLRSDFSKGGVSEDLIKMQTSEMETIYKSYLKKNINLVFFITASIFSLLKFIRRLLISIL